MMDIAAVAEVDVEGHAAVIDKGLEEVLDKTGIKFPDLPSPREGDIINKVWPAADIKGDGCERLIHRQQGAAVPPDPLFVPGRPGYSLTQYDAYILYGVVIVYLQVTHSFDVEIKQSMFRKKDQHVVEEGDACVYLSFTITINRKSQFYVGLRSFPFYGSLSGHILTFPSIFVPSLFLQPRYGHQVLRFRQFLRQHPRLSLARPCYT